MTIHWFLLRAIICFLIDFSFGAIIYWAIERGLNALIAMCIAGFMVLFLLISIAVTSTNGEGRKPFEMPPYISKSCFFLYVMNGGSLASMGFSLSTLIPEWIDSGMEYNSVSFALIVIFGLNCVWTVVVFFIPGLVMTLFLSSGLILMVAYFLFSVQSILALCLIGLGVGEYYNGNVWYSIKTFGSGLTPCLQCPLPIEKLQISLRYLEACGREKSWDANLTTALLAKHCRYGSSYVYENWCIAPIQDLMQNIRFMWVVATVLVLVYLVLYCVFAVSYKNSSRNAAILVAVLMFGTSCAALGLYLSNFLTLMNLGEKVNSHAPCVWGWSESTYNLTLSQNCSYAHQQEGDCRMTYPCCSSSFIVKWGQESGRKMGIAIISFASSLVFTSFFVLGASFVPAFFKQKKNPYESF